MQTGEVIAQGHATNKKAPEFEPRAGRSHSCSFLPHGCWPFSVLVSVTTAGLGSACPRLSSLEWGTGALEGHSDATQETLWLLQTNELKRPQGVARAQVSPEQGHGSSGVQLEQIGNKS